MNKKYLYIFILVCIIILVPYYDIYKPSFIEGFETKTKTIVLLGDSILKNNSYVTNGVDKQLNESTDCEVVSLARDKTTIGHTYKQVDDIPKELNKNTTVLVLSAGGNDIIEDYINGPYDADENQSHINKVFDSYKLLVEGLRSKMDNARIVLLDIYYPSNNQYKDFYPLIKNWNKLQSEYAVKNKDIVCKISESLNQSQDFAFDIEPSDTGGKKIVEAILSSIE